MTITIDSIVEIGKLVSAIICIAGIPLGIYKLFKKWTTSLFEKIDRLEESVTSLKTEVENMKRENDRRFKELNDNITDMKGTSRTFYSVFNTMVEVIYKHHPSDELAEAKKTVTNELINKATEVHHEYRDQ